MAKWSIDGLNLLYLIVCLSLCVLSLCCLLLIRMLWILLCQTMNLNELRLSKIRCDAELTNDIIKWNENCMQKVRISDPWHLTSSRGMWRQYKRPKIRINFTLNIVFLPVVIDVILVTASLLPSHYHWVCVVSRKLESGQCEDVRVVLSGMVINNVESLVDINS